MKTVQTTETAVVTLTVRYFAAAKAAAGTAEEQLEVPAGATIDEALAAARSRHDTEFARVLERCSFLLDEVAVRDKSQVVHEGATLDVLPPFAGG
ncbi:Molybdopterin converting factor, small subunit [Pseudonocardia thermophila]|jgi:Molybdopterin converting factor, small subunit|uniref:Molybdopterin synthase sulfur carrier subunit n=1 Tax=Pseudonocardia thermophila TaxID=1848 RepID=A0A1M6YCH8_PSETH|nr:MoaD/ThiS family protein [Pseudonocardia thermophila]SHL16016.1 Molybdopterin converting factor, small subunit [Pseudonocardia thermophila]